MPYSKTARLASLPPIPFGTTIFINSDGLRLCECIAFLVYVILKRVLSLTFLPPMNLRLPFCPIIPYQERYQRQRYRDSPIDPEPIGYHRCCLPLEERYGKE